MLYDVVHVYELVRVYEVVRYLECAVGTAPVRRAALHAHKLFSLVL